MNFLPILLNIWMMELGVMTIIWILIFMILVRRKHQMSNYNLKYKIISQFGPDRHSPLQVKTLEIWMIQEEPGLISKEWVLRSIVLIIFCPKLVI